MPNLVKNVYCRQEIPMSAALKTSTYFVVDLEAFKKMCRLIDLGMSHLRWHLHAAALQIVRNLPAHINLADRRVSVVVTEATSESHTWQQRKICKEIKWGKFPKLAQMYSQGCGRMTKSNWRKNKNRYEKYKNIEVEENSDDGKLSGTRPECRHIPDIKSQWKAGGNCRSCHE